MLKLSAKNQARRFISLIDALYEARCRIICLAEAEPEQLFFPDAPSASTADRQTREGDDVDVMMAEAVAETQEVYRPNVSSYDAPNMAQERVPTQTLALDTLSIFSGQCLSCLWLTFCLTALSTIGKDEQFAFKRALSRLLEMTSESYAKEEQWTPLPIEARKWEKSGLGSVLPTASAAPTHTQAKQVHSSDAPDFAEEATQERTSTSPADRPPAPRLSADHIWGVREDWGERARDWGRGASIYADPSPKPNNLNSSPSPSPSPSSSESPVPVPVPASASSSSPASPSPATRPVVDGSTQPANGESLSSGPVPGTKRAGGGDGASVRR